MSWGETLDQQKSALRWDIKRSLNSLCRKLADIGEECFVVTINVSNGWVGHMGSVRGNEYINQKSYIPYDFLDYCRELDESCLSFTGHDDESVNGGGDKQKKEEGDSSMTDSDDSDAEDNDDDKPVTLSLDQSGSSTDDQDEVQPVSQESTHADGENGNKLLKIKSKKIIKSARQHLIRTYSKKQRRQSESDTASVNIRPGAKITTQDGKLKLYCTACELSFPNRSNFMDHIKSRPHLLTSQKLLQCFKCFQKFESCTDMYTHMKQCDMLTSVLNLVRTDYHSTKTELSKILAL